MNIEQIVEDETGATRQLIEPVDLPEDTSGILQYAARELDLVLSGCPDQNSRLIQENINHDILLLLSLLASFNHTETVKEYALGIVKRLSNSLPLTPLTLLPDEFVAWTDGSEHNRRLPAVIKKNGSMVYLDGIAWTIHYTVDSETLSVNPSGESGGWHGRAHIIRQGKPTGMVVSSVTPIKQTSFFNPKTFVIPVVNLTVDEHGNGLFLVDETDLVAPMEYYDLEILPDSVVEETLAEYLHGRELPTEVIRK